MRGIFIISALNRRTNTATEGKPHVKKRFLSCLIALACLALMPVSAVAHTRDEVRAAWRGIAETCEDTPYLSIPSPVAPYEPGALSPEASLDALNMLNFARWLAGLDPVTDSAIYDFQCQRAAVLLAALDYVDHDAPRPDDMDRDTYDAAHLGTSSGNIAKFNWMRAGILREGVTYFVRDDGDMNLGILGHRRWALNPLMAATGFGLANSETGMSYVVMYAHDLGNPDAKWESVYWPAEGAFPAELMHDHLAWSVVLNPEIYDLAASAPEVTLTEETLGLSFRFHPALGTGDGFCEMNLEPYGPGGAIIFRPDFAGGGFTDYQQNQRWRVRVDGLVTADGADASLAYGVDMVSLTAQDAVNIEISQLEATLAVGNTLRLVADVIPAYADDVSVRWMSSDVSVASVAGDGTVTAVAPGDCTVICENAAGHQDSCRLTVTD